MTGAEIEIEIAPSKETKVGDTITSRDFQLGDTVRNMNSATAWDTSTVIGITKSTAKLYRPFVHLGDFSCAHSHMPYTAHHEHGLGVLHYIGIEDYAIHRCDDDAWELLNRVKLK